MTQQLGWFGLGSMGLGMALNLQKHLKANSLPPLHYSNRSLSKGQLLQDAGAIPKDNFEELVQTCDIIVTMISIDAVLTDLLTRAFTSNISLEGKIFIDTSTIHPETSSSASERLRERGAAFIAAPVFGASPVAAAGKLIFAVAGPEAAVEVVRPYIQDVMGRCIIDMGEDVTRSSLLKICGNILVLSFQQVLSESHIFAEKTGLGTANLQSFISLMFGSVLESYSTRITSGAYAPPLDTPPGFAASLACKDMMHALDIAEQSGMSLPTLETAYGRLSRAREFAGEWVDSSAVYGEGRREAGLGFWSENSRKGN
ncbi:NAD(P)-dependent oxidoreductase [Aspergillus stella-maris]|uniref:NAD(P)-dependent oxidoreductase n=1 Tax=Aspergillus stella-maris TaxID=1810926 RepID=UPI003CCD5B9B